MWTENRFIFWVQAAVMRGHMKNISVELLRNTEEGGTYYAVIYVDDGDKKFDHKIDLLATTADGNPVMDVFGVIRR